MKIDLDGSGIEAVFDSFKKLPDDTNFILLGHNWSTDYFNDLVQKKDIAEKVLFVDPLPANYVPKIASYAKIGITPAIYDGTLSSFLSLHNKVFDYIKSEIPFIATDLPEHINILENFKNGITIYDSDSQKVEQISNAFFEIINNYEYYKKMHLDVHLISIRKMNTIKWIKYFIS